MSSPLFFFHCKTLASAKVNIIKLVVNLISILKAIKRVLFCKQLNVFSCHTLSVSYKKDTTQDSKPNNYLTHVQLTRD